MLKVSLGLPTKNDYLDYFDSRRVSNPLAVTLSLKQRIELNDFKGLGLKIDKTETSKNTRHFLNRLNQSVFGKGFNRYNRRLAAIPVIEGNSFIRFHVHLTLQRPDHIEPRIFEKLIYDCWSKTTFGYHNIKIKPIYDYMGWIEYKLKSKSKDEGLHSSVDWDNVFLH